MTSSPAPRLLLGRGIANHPGLVRAIRDATPDLRFTIAVHHTKAPGTDPVDDVDCFIPERGPSAGSTESYVDDLLAACDDFGATHVWPGRELPSVFARAGELRASGIMMLAAASADVARVLDDKDRFAQATEMLGIKAPRSVRFHDADGFVAAAAAIHAAGERVCVKPVRGVFGRGFRVIRNDLDPLAELFEEPGYRLDYDDAVRRFRVHPSFAPMVAMPWLDGREWSVDCFADASGEVFVGVPRRKQSADAQLLDDAPDLVAHSRALARHFNLRGVFNCQFKAHRGDVYVLEINARPAGAIGLTRHSGVNLIGLAWQDALGLPLGPTVPRLGIALRSTTSWSPLSTAAADTAATTTSTSKTASSLRTAPAAATTTVLPTGTLTMTKRAGPWSTSALLSAGARSNPKRPFLLVSRVLGKHLPVTPSRMGHAQMALAKRLHSELPGPVCFIGLAETATGLGFGVYEAWCARTGRSDALFCHSTRSPAPSSSKDVEGAIAFDEAHSHGPSQVVCVPRDAGLQAMWREARTLVVVDDELTTGATLRTLRDAFVAARREPGVVTHAVTLVSSTLARATLGDAGIAVTALADVDVDFAASCYGGLPPLTLHGLAELGHGVGLKRWGRIGTKAAPALPSSILARALAFSRGLGEAGGHREVFVLGTGECMHPAFVLGMGLERAGVPVLLQSTTRSPVLLGGAIGSSLDLGASVVAPAVPFFLHNPPPSGARVIVVHEPGAGRDARVFVESYGALAIEAWDGEHGV